MYKFGTINLGKSKIVITCKAWREIAENLLGKGLKIYEDFVPYWMFEYESIDYTALADLLDDDEIEKLIKIMSHNKKIVILYGNCHANKIGQYLSANEEFFSKYIILRIPILSFADPYKLLLKKRKQIFKHASIFICQNVHSTNKFGCEFSTENILQYIPSGCKIIKIPALYFTGYWPQTLTTKYKQLITKNGPNRDFYSSGEELIAKFYHEGKTEDEIIKIVLDENFFSKEEVEKEINESFHLMIEKEKKCDIKMSDFIRENYKEYQMFLDPIHPVNKVYHELALRILKHIGIYDEEFDNVNSLDHCLNKMSIEHMAIVYPSVIKHTQLKEYQKFYFPNGMSSPEISYDIKAWIRDFIRVCLKEPKKE